MYLARLIGCCFSIPHLHRDGVCMTERVVCSTFYCAFVQLQLERDSLKKENVRENRQNLLSSPLVCNHSNSIHKEHQPLAAVVDTHTHSHASSAADANRGAWTAVLKWNLLEYHREAMATEWRLWHQSQHTVTLIEISYEWLILAFDMLATGVILWLFEYVD